MFRRIGRKEDLCVIGVCDASYHYDDRSVAGEIIMLGNKNNERAAPIYWKSGVIRKVCTLPKAAETRALMRLIDDGTTLVRQISQQMNVEVTLGHFWSQ